MDERQKEQEFYELIDKGNIKELVFFYGLGRRVLRALEENGCKAGVDVVNVADRDLLEVKGCKVGTFGRTLLLKRYLLVEYGLASVRLPAEHIAGPARGEYDEGDIEKLNKLYGLGGSVVNILRRNKCKTGKDMLNIDTDHVWTEDKGERKQAKFIHLLHRYLKAAYGKAEHRPAK